MPIWSRIPGIGGRRVIPHNAKKKTRTMLGESDRTNQETPPAFDRSETIVCMVIAFCLGNAALSIIYRVMG
jgi:hypothetical protein